MKKIHTYYWRNRNKHVFVIPGMIRHPKHSRITGFQISRKRRFKEIALFYKIIMIIFRKADGLGGDDINHLVGMNNQTG